MAALGTALFVAHGWLSVRHPHADQVVLPTAAMLAALSMVMVARLQPDLALRQAIWVGLGSVALLGTLVVLPGVEWLRQYRYTWAALGLLLVLSTFVFGIDPNGSGARLWLGYGGVYFQPSEILKILLVVFFAAYLDDYRELLTLSSVRVGPFSLPPLPYLAPLLLMLALALGLVVLQRDLGAALLLFGLFLAMLYRGDRARHLRGRWAWRCSCWARTCCTGCSAWSPSASRPGSIRGPPPPRRAISSCRG